MFSTPRIGECRYRQRMEHAHVANDGQRIRYMIPKTYKKKKTANHDEVNGTGEQHLYGVVP